MWGGGETQHTNGHSKGEDLKQVSEFIASLSLLLRGPSSHCLVFQKKGEFSAPLNRHHCMAFFQSWRQVTLCWLWGAAIDVPMTVPLHRAPGKCFLSKETSDRGSMKNSWKTNLPEPTVTPKNYFPFTCFREGKHSKVGYINDRWEVLGKLASTAGFGSSTFQILYD